MDSGLYVWKLEQNLSRQIPKFLDSLGSGLFFQDPKPNPSRLDGFSEI